MYVKTRKFALCMAASITVLASATAANAGNILIINGASGTSEPGTTASITTQLTNLHTAVGNTVSVVDSIPASFAGFQQVWDIRFSNTFALNASDVANYVSYLAGGGGMFVMGENSGFMSRNNSVLALITAAGGGTLAFTSPGATQQVYAPFDGPNAVSSVTYAAPGGVDGFGTGQWITSNAAGTAGTGVAWAKGTLANASNGALTTIFDVNFMMTNANEGNQNLTKNLIGFVGGQVEVPEPMTWAMMVMGFGLVGFALRGQRRRISVSYN